MTKDINNLRTFLDLDYAELETRNLKAKKAQMTQSQEECRVEYLTYLKKETRIKAVTLCFCDIEGKLHMLDYDKQFLLSSYENLTFDGSSVRGFSALNESDLRLDIDWSSFMWLPSDVFGPGKVLMFTYISNRDLTPYEFDTRGMLSKYAQTIKKQSLEGFISCEIEGFLVEGVNAEQNFDRINGFSLVSTGGYYHSLPKDKLRLFIDACAEAQRAMGFENEKDHPEVAPAQFELNFSYGPMLRIADQILLYKLVCRQVAANMSLTATFLPKPKSGINGSGMHTNLSIFSRSGNLFYDKKGRDNLSSFAHDGISRILNHAPELCLLLNSSVNAYRRLDPRFEAPNRIQVSPNDRGSMIRIPSGNEKTSRIEVRSVAPDANPYLVTYALVRTFLEGKKLPLYKKERNRVRLLPGDIYDAIRLFRIGKFTDTILGKEFKDKYIQWKTKAADRCPKLLGSYLKEGEVLFNHEVTNQYIWESY